LIPSVLLLLKLKFIKYCMTSIMNKKAEKWQKNDVSCIFYKKSLPQNIVAK